jgi:HlyD family secretion protein
VIDPEQLQAAVDQAAAQVGAADASVLQALATITETRLALERARSLRGQGLLGQGELETANANAQRAEAGAANARAQATLARASLKSARSKLDKTIIYSPIDGTVLTRLVEPGQTVTAGFTTPVLFKIAQDLTRMALTVAVDEADVGRVSDGLEATFTVEAYPERLFVSKVLSVGNEPTKTTNVVTYDAVLTVDNADRALRPGMTCTSTIVAQTRRDVLLVSNAALRFSPPTSTGGGGPGGPAGAAASSIVTTPAPEGTKRVWLLRDGKTLEPFDLHTGATDGVSTEIAEGALPVGTQVVVDVKEDAP